MASNLFGFQPSGGIATVVFYGYYDSVGGHRQKFTITLGTLVPLSVSVCSKSIATKYLH